MKTKLLTAGAIITILACVVSIVILSLSLSKASSKTKSLNAELAKLTNQVIVLSTGKAANQVDQKLALYRRDFISHHDYLPDSYLIAPPVSPPIDNKYTLIVYLHGMGSNYMEPYTVSSGETIGDAIHKKYPSFVIASLNYGKQTAWGNPKSSSEISQNINEVMYAYPVDKIVMMGSSMGGCVSLNYAATAPENIKEKIIGVVSIEGSGDLADLYETTTKDVVKLGIARAMGGEPSKNPQAYKQASFLSNIDKVPNSVRFSIVSAKNDDTVAPRHQKRIKKALDNGQYPNKLIELEIGHEFPKSEVYVDALNFILAK